MGLGMIIPISEYHIGFTGSRDGVTEHQRRWMFHFLSKAEDSTIVHHGDCVGADEEFHNCARERGLRIMLHPPNNNAARAFCKGDYEMPPLPYIQRNHAIVEASIHMLAIPSSHEVLRSGTWATVRYARKLKRPLFIVYPDGEISTK